MKLIFSAIALLAVLSCSSDKEFKPSTKVSIEGEKFYINGQPTFKGRSWHGVSIEGLLPNSRMVQGVFDDLNPETVS